MTCSFEVVHKRHHKHPTNSGRTRYSNVPLSYVREFYQLPLHFGPLPVLAAFKLTILPRRLQRQVARRPHLDIVRLMLYDQS
jgi:hypothetical protein